MTKVFVSNCCASLTWEKVSDSKYVCSKCRLECFLVEVPPLAAQSQTSPKQNEVERIIQACADTCPKSTFESLEQFKNHLRSYFSAATQSLRNEQLELASGYALQVAEIKKLREENEGLKINQITGGTALYIGLAERLIKGIVSAESSTCGQPTDIELKLHCIIRERDSLTIQLTAAKEAISPLAAWWSMVQAQYELEEGKPIPEDTFVLSFMGSGASAHVTAGQLNKALFQTTPPTNDKASQ